MRTINIRTWERADDMFLEFKHSTKGTLAGFDKIKDVEHVYLADTVNGHVFRTWGCKPGRGLFVDRYTEAF